MALKTLGIAAEILRSLSYADISSSYAAVGGGLLYPSPIYSAQNQTDADLYWSWDGVNDNGFLPASGGHFIYDIATNRDDYQQDLGVPQGRILYVRYSSSAPTLGSIYVTSLYSQRSS
ncbi:hypothetical protein UFOVP9_62 [uncultured Caudovirales phage]|jgi:hypothetical protein|uniref:Uncharacterized protein n=1 Tax=uncultured Caudovirales phage TaxID=2100421 RepID=A0A6J5KJJ2_9CAUD|nr:hypothetical protein UFOVP9_62 [uncultured Caudovirales phage]